MDIYINHIHPFTTSIILKVDMFVFCISPFVTNRRRRRPIAPDNIILRKNFSINVQIPK